MANADMTFHAFVWYVKHNRYKSMDNMTEDDFDNMVEGYARENSAEITWPDSRSAGSTFTDIDWPGAIIAKKDTLTTDQADYPEGHGKAAVYGA